MEKFLKREIMVPIIVVIVCLLLCLLSKKLLHKIFKYKSKRISNRKKNTVINLINNIICFIIVLIGAIIILEIYGINTKSLVTSFGVLGVVTGLAFQDLLKDFIVGISIIFEGQYSIGDWVSVNGFKGEVLPSNLRITKIRAYTGEVKIVSNKNIIELINYSLNASNLIIDIGVAYESDVEKVKTVLDEMCKEIKTKYKIKEFTCLGVQELSDNSIVFRLVALTKYLEQFHLDREIKKEILLTFEKNNITIPYDQVVIHNG